MKSAAITVRLTPTARKLIRDLAAYMGLSQASVIELAVRELGRRQNIGVEEEEKV